MPEVIFTGPAGRLEGRYHPAKQKNAPIAIAPPANLYVFSFLAPCPSSGLIVHGERDAVVPPKEVNTLVEKLKTQNGIMIDQQIIPGANPFFDGKLEPLMETVTGYLDMP